MAEMSLEHLTELTSSLLQNSELWWQIADREANFKSLWQHIYSLVQSEDTSATRMKKHSSSSSQFREVGVIAKFFVEAIGCGWEETSEENHRKGESQTFGLTDRSLYFIIFWLNSSKLILSPCCVLEPPTTNIGDAFVESSIRWS